MDGRRGARGVHSPFFFFFFCSPPWKYPAEALGRVLPGSQDVNVNFLPVTEETLPHAPALVPPPALLAMVTRLFSQRSLFSVSRLVRPRNQTLRNISASGSQGRETQHLGAVLISSKQEGGRIGGVGGAAAGAGGAGGGGGPLSSQLFRATTFAHCQSSAVIAMPVF